MKQITLLLVSLFLLTTASYGEPSNPSSGHKFSEEIHGRLLDIDDDFITMETTDGEILTLSIHPRRTRHIPTKKVLRKGSFVHVTADDSLRAKKVRAVSPRRARRGTR